MLELKNAIKRIDSANEKIECVVKIAENCEYWKMNKMGLFMFFENLGLTLESLENEYPEFRKEISQAENRLDVIFKEFKQEIF